MKDRWQHEALSCASKPRTHTKINQKHSLQNKMYNKSFWNGVGKTKPWNTWLFFLTQGRQAEIVCTCLYICVDMCLGRHVSICFSILIRVSFQHQLKCDGLYKPILRFLI